MGNRAVIAFGSKKDDLGIYLHWNGGVESVLAFLEATKRLGHRDPMSDCYGIARMCQVIGNFFGGNNSLGIGKVSELDADNHDNGLFEIGPGFTIKCRKYSTSSQKCVEDLSPKEREYYEGVLAEVMEKNILETKEAA